MSKCGFFKFTNPLWTILPAIIIIALLASITEAAPTVNTVDSAGGVDQSLALDLLNPAAWQMECIYCEKWFDQMSSRSAAYDSSGVLHAAYGGEQLYYGSLTGGDQWVSEVVDSKPDVGLFASLALDSGDQPHIVYLDSSAGGFRYAAFDGGSWSIESIPYADMDTYKPASFALDSQDRPHVSFYDPVAQELIHGDRETSGWVFETVDGEGYVQYSSLAIDGQDEPHIAYRDLSSRCINYAEFSDPDWSIAEFCDSKGYTENIELGLDSGGSPHLFSLEGHALIYRYLIGDDWQNEEVLPEGKYDGYESLSMILDDDDLPHLSLARTVMVDPYSHGNTWLDYMALTTDGWIHETPIEYSYSLDYPNYSTVLLKSDATPAIVYKDCNELGLVSSSGAGAWSAISLDQSGFSESAPSLTWHPDGYAQVGFYAHEEAILRLAARQGDAWLTEFEQGFRHWGLIKTVLLSETSEREHLFWIGDSRYRACLHYSYGDFLDGPYCMLAPADYDAVVDLDGIRHLAVYYTGLRYYSMIDDYTWSDYELIDSHGEEVSIDADSEGVPHVVYAGSPLNYAVRTGTGWDLSTIPGAYGEYPDLKLDSLDHLHIVYFTSTGHLGHAEFDGSSWVVEVIDDASDVGRHPSLAIDPSDGLHISYYDGTTADLKYAYDDGSGWQTTTLVSEGDVGLYSSLTVDPFGFPKIAFLDSTNQDLMYIYQEFSPSYFFYFPIVGRD